MLRVLFPIWNSKHALCEGMPVNSNTFGLCDSNANSLHLQHTVIAWFDILTPTFIGIPCVINSSSNIMCGILICCILAMGYAVYV